MTELSKKHKDKISEGLKKAYATGKRKAWQKGLKGFKHSGSFKKGQTAWNKGKSNTWCKGEKNNFWKGGISLDRKKYSTERSRAFRKNNPETNKEYNERGYDKFYFSGNREKAIKRDEEQCKICGINREEHKEKYKEDLNVHHIDGNGKNQSKENKNNKLDNLITLCKSCHRKEHKNDIKNNSKN